MVIIGTIILILKMVHIFFTFDVWSTLQFDLFYTTIKTSDIPVENLEKDIYDKFERWLKNKGSYRIKTGDGYGFCYDDDAVILWLKETIFNKSKIEILEKHLNQNKPSQYESDITIYF